MTDETASQPRIGRPRKARGELRSERLPDLRVTPSERAAVEAAAAMADMGVTEFCRRAILGQRIAAAPARRAQAQLLAEINRIGVNLNQLTRAANAGRSMPSSVAEAAAEVRAMVARLAELVR